MSNKWSCSKSFRSLLNLFLIDGPIYEMLFWPKLYVDVTIVITVLNYNYTYFFVANVGFYYRVQLIFLKCCSEKLSFRNLIWVNKDENMIPQQISLTIGQCISHSYWKQISFLKLYILRPSQHLFAWIQQ